MLLTLFAFFIVLSILVIVHEVGHFWTARRFGVKVDEFGLGLPPRAIGFYRDDSGKIKTVGIKHTETKKMIWSLNWIPLGGFVKIKGEEGDGPKDPDSFVSQKVWKRIIIVSAGVFMNFILAAFLLTVSLTFGSPQMIENNLSKLAKVSDEKIRIVDVLPGSPAAKAGIVIGDNIISIDNADFSKIENIQEYMNEKLGQTVVVKVEKQAEVIDLEISPIVLGETQKGGIGVALVKIGFVSYPWYISWWYGFGETFKTIGDVLYGFYAMLKNLIVDRQMIGEVYGPVGIAGMVGDAARMGFLYVLQFTAILSILIAVINFLPFPALDGGRVFFLIIEGIRRKPVNQRFEAAMHNIGFALLMIMVVIVTFRDIARVSSGFVNWWQKISGLF